MYKPFGHNDNQGVVNYSGGTRPYLFYYKLSYGKKKVFCKDICKTVLHGIKGISNSSPYKLGYVYCNRCGYYFKDKPGVQHCECCGRKLRRRSRQKK